MKYFKIFAISIVVLIAILSTSSSVYGYFKYKQIEKINGNLNIIVQNNNNDIKNLRKEISEKKAEIVEVEKIIYKDGELIIPIDYEELKKNYASLSKIYLTTKDLLDETNVQIEKDAIIIGDLQKQNEDLLKQLGSRPKISLLAHSILFGYGISEKGNFYSASYQATILSKFLAQVTASYPAQISLSVGMKL